MRALAAALLTLSLVACTEEVVCPPTQTACDRTCVSLLSDERHCGACGADVLRLEICSGGSPDCRPGIATCDGVCTDFARDPANCGGCGAACDAGGFCTTDGAGTRCTDACPAGFAPCDGACVDLQQDLFHCGACGVTCADGETCRDGACSADLLVACYNTEEVVPVTADLKAAGFPRMTPTGPIALAVLGGAAYAVNGYPAASLSVLPLDPFAPSLDVTVAGDDLQAIVPHENVLLVSNAADGTLLVFDAAGGILDEIALPEQQTGPNPHGVAVVGSTAFVALYGNATGAGQGIAKVDLSTLAACAAPDPAAAACGDGGACPSGRGCVDGRCRVRCGSVTGVIPLHDVAGSHDDPGFPLPDAAVAAFGRVYVSLANLADDPTDAYAFLAQPAGSGKIAIVDPATSGVGILDLGDACWKAGAMALHGTTLWVACGSWSYPDLAPSRLVPIELSGPTPALGTPIDVPGVPSKLAFCGGVGYLGDQSSGNVMRFDPLAGTTEEPAKVCLDGEWGYASVSDIACSR